MIGQVSPLDDERADNENFRSNVLNSHVFSGGSVCSSPDLDGSKLGTSPQINRFLAREPPDGCEKVC